MTMQVPASREVYNARRRRRRRRIIRRRIAIFLVAAVVIAFIAVVCTKIFSGNESGETKTAEQSSKQLEALENAVIPEWIDSQIIDIHNTARTGTKLTAVNNIVIHYVGNPGTTAQNNRDYYNKPDTEVSSHFIVGLGGEVLQCVPLNEKSSASNHRNKDTISIEVCHPDDTGEFNSASYDSLVRLTAWLCDLCELDSNDIIRHYDVTGKNCPKYFVEHEDAWEQFKDDVKTKTEVK